MSFTSFIKKQTDRNDPQGDFARDHVWTLERSSYFSAYSELKGTEGVESDTLLGHYNFLPQRVKNKDYVLEALCGLWREWIAYKHIGLRYNEPSFGYVYFFKIQSRSSIFKVGRTSVLPYDYLPSVEGREKAKFEIVYWIKVRNYDLIEKELHKAFHRNRITREFFELDIWQIYTAIHLYRMTDENSEVLPDDYIDIYDDYMSQIQADHPRFAFRGPLRVDKVRDFDIEV